MDEDLKQYLTEMEGRIVAVIAGEVASIHTDMGHRFDAVNTQLASIDTRLKLQAGLIQSGTRAMARFSEFSENSEQRWTDLALRVLAIEQKLEGSGPR